MNTIFDNAVVRKVIISLGVILGLFLLAQTFVELKSLRFVGVTPINNTITVTGHGEVSLAPDLATVSFAVEKTSATVAEAQAQVVADLTKVLDAVKALGISSDDIQTTQHSIYPKYEYEQSICTATRCSPSRSTLVGYTVYNSVTIKIRDLDKASNVLTTLATNGATNVSGLNFGFDNEDKPKEEARAKAIAQAQEKAQTLAKQLGVKLVSIASFSETGGNYPLYAKASVGGAYDMSEMAPAVPVEVGQNTIESTVSITYQIR